MFFGDNIKKAIRDIDYICEDNIVKKQTTKNY